jgi:hypothetical protein
VPIVGFWRGTVVLDVVFDILTLHVMNEFMFPVSSAKSTGEFWNSGANISGEAEPICCANTEILWIS